MRIYLSILLFTQIFYLGGCVSSKYEAKKRNPLVAWWLPFASNRTKQAYDHSLIRSHRYSSDCGATCPKVDVWLYRLKDGDRIIESDKPISIQKKYWKSPDEARIIAISLFGESEFYFQSLLQYLQSFQHIKRVNNIHDKIWGYETFTVRVYVPKRNPKDLDKLGEIKGKLPQKHIDKLLKLGCEIAYTDNKLTHAQKDGTFWRFSVVSDEMPKGQKIRYLLRDADNILTSVEMYSVADWIKSDKLFHRMHVIPICIGPLTAMSWGGSHEGKGNFSDFKNLVENFPYRFQYGDDELFSRDLLWPRIKASGSVLTHHFQRSGFLNTIANPYAKSCEEPTQEFCLRINQNASCEDRVLPNLKRFQGSIEALGLRMSLEELWQKHPEYFDLKLDDPENKFIFDAFKSK